MRLESVRQLQTMNSMMKEQFAAYPVENAIVLGVAGGNGLEHIDPDKYRIVYGVDINREYLHAVSKRFNDLSGILKLVGLDLINEVEKLPQSQFVIANLLIEYIGYEQFKKVIAHVKPQYVSAVIQINVDDKWVSDSPYIHAFDDLERVHCQMDERALSEAMDDIGYRLVLREVQTLPNGKALVRLDFVQG